MRKSALSPVIAVVLLISLSIVIAGIMLFWARSVVTDLSPPAENCKDVFFSAGIFNEDGDYFLDVVNRGNVDVNGFIIKLKDIGTVKEIERVEGVILAGKSESFKLLNVGQEYSGENFIIVPVVGVERNGEKENYVCDGFGEEV
jgi:lipopolysaccharide export LptBFGC system permease protein LptF